MSLRTWRGQRRLPWPLPRRSRSPDLIEFVRGPCFLPRARDRQRRNNVAHEHLYEHFTRPCKPGGRIGAMRSPSDPRSDARSCWMASSAVAPIVTDACLAESKSHHARSQEHEGARSGQKSLGLYRFAMDTYHQMPPEFIKLSESLAGTTGYFSVEPRSPEPPSVEPQAWNASLKSGQENARAHQSHHAVNVSILDNPRAPIRHRTTPAAQSKESKA